MDFFIKIAFLSSPWQSATGRLVSTVNIIKTFSLKIQLKIYNNGRKNKIIYEQYDMIKWQRLKSNRERKL